jgi:hypothetical protein
MASTRQLVLLGDATQNLWLSKLSVKPFDTSRLDAISFGRCRISRTEQRVGYLFVAPRYDDALGHSLLNLVLSATDFDGLRDITSYSFSSNTPLTRAAFTNMVPDFMVTSPQFAARGMGGIRAAGFFGNDWQLSSQVYSKC